MVGWIVNLKGCGRKQTWPNLFWHLNGGTEENRENSLRIVSVLGEIWARHFLNPGQTHYCLSQLFGTDLMNKISQVPKSMVWDLKWDKILLLSLPMNTIVRSSKQTSQCLLFYSTDDQSCRSITITVFVLFLCRICYVHTDCLYRTFQVFLTRVRNMIMNHPVYA
jgi:hypothetical protein